MKVAQQVLVLGHDLHLGRDFSQGFRQRLVLGYCALGSGAHGFPGDLLGAHGLRQLSEGFVQRDDRRGSPSEAVQHRVGNLRDVHRGNRAQTTARLPRHSLTAGDTLQIARIYATSRAERDGSALGARTDLTHALAPNRFAPRMKNPWSLRIGLRPSHRQKTWEDQ